MIRVVGRGAVYGEVWSEEDPPRDRRRGYRHVPPERGTGPRRVTVPFLSIVTDLSADEEAIQGRFGKDCRYKIRRADGKDGLSMECNADPASRLDEFGAFFDAFAREKGIWLADRRWLARRLQGRTARARLGLAERRDPCPARVPDQRQGRAGCNTRPPASGTGTAISALWSGAPTAGSTGGRCCGSRRWG